MAFKAKINSIGSQQTGAIVNVTFTDDVTGFSLNQDFTFPTDGTVTAAQAQATIIAAGAVYKSNLTIVAALQAKVGTVLTI